MQVLGGKSRVFRTSPKAVRQTEALPPGSFPKHSPSCIGPESLPRSASPWSEEAEEGLLCGVP